MSARVRDAGRGTPRRAVTPLRPGRFDRSQLRVLLAGRGLLGRFTYLVATQAVTVVLGLAYWTATARLIPSRSVGVAAAATSTATLLGTLGVLGVSTIMLVSLGTIGADDERPLVTTGLMVSAASVFLLAMGAWALSPLLGPSLRALGSSPLDAGLFVVGAVLTTCGSVLDAAAIGLRRGPAQLARNAVASFLKVALVLAAVFAAVRSATGLLLAWDVALAVSLVMAPRLLGLRRERGRRVGLARRLELVRRLWSLSIAHHLLNLAIGSISYALPVIAALLVAPRQMAYFSIAQLVSSSVLLLPFLLATSLFVESTGDEMALRRNVRRTFPVGLACCAAVLAVFEPSARFALSVFGHEYEANGSLALRLLLLGGLPYVVKDHFMAIRRSQNRLGEATRLGLLATAGELLGAGIGGVMDGLPGLCGAWVVATVIEAAFFLPAVLRVLRSGDPSAMAPAAPTPVTTQPVPATPASAPGAPAVVGTARTVGAARAMARPVVEEEATFEVRQARGG